MLELKHQQGESITESKHDAKYKHPRRRNNTEETTQKKQHEQQQEKSTRQKYS